MTRPIVFLDTETTSLRPDRRAWEIALILRRPDKPDFEQSWLILPVPEAEKSEDLSRAIGVDPGKFDRHTALGDCQWTRAMFDTMNGSQPG